LIVLRVRRVLDPASDASPDGTAVVKDRFISSVKMRLSELVATTDPITRWYPMNRPQKDGRLLVGTSSASLL